MGLCAILTLSRSAVSISKAFEAEGVALEFPARSRSGIRGSDGMVIFAMSAMEVRTTDWGSSCPLWLPGSGAERLAHCRLALQFGVAEGFVLDRSDNPPAEFDLLTLVVVRTGEEYWARWGTVARSQSFGRR